MDVPVTRLDELLDLHPHTGQEDSSDLDLILDPVPTDMESFALSNTLNGAGRSELTENHEKFSRLVGGISKRLKSTLPSFVEFDDLSQEGWVGLMQAADGFDPNHNVSLKLYAKRRVRGEMLDSLRRDDPLTRLARKYLSQINKAEIKLRQQLNSDPSNAQVAEALNIPLDQLIKRKARALKRVLSLDAPADSQEQCLNHEVYSGENILNAENILNPEEALLKARGFQDIIASSKSLTKKEISVLHKFYVEGVFLSEIGEIFGISESGAAKVKEEALKKLKKRFKALNCDLNDLL